MSRVILNNSATVPSPPAAGKVSIFSETVNKGTKQIDETGFVQSLSQIDNWSTAAQSPTAATRTYLTGSALKVARQKLQVGTHFCWKWNMTKNANGLAASTIDIAVGTAGTTADTARVSFTKPAGTAVADEGFCEVNAIVRSIGAAGVMVGEFWMIHNLAATGHMVIPSCCVNTVSAGFDMTVVDLIVGICLTSGAADAITVQQMQAWAWNM